jgi:hypothetical protein
VPAVKVKVVVLIVAGFIASLKVAVTTVLGQTPVARFGGAVETTVGGIHGVALVVKLQTKLLASAMPNCVLGTGRNRGGIERYSVPVDFDGVKVAVSLDAS